MSGRVKVVVCSAQLSSSREQGGEQCSEFQVRWCHEGEYVSRCSSGEDWAVVVWLLLLRRVVTSKPPPCPHRHCHKQTGRRFVCCERHVEVSRASKQVKYVILAMSLRHILCRRGHAWSFTVSSRLPNAQSHVANHQRKPPPVPDVCAHACLPRASHVLLPLPHQTP